METEAAYRVGARVRVCEHHRVAARRGMVGTIVGRYGGEEHVAIDVRFSDGEHRLFRPCDLEEVCSRVVPGGAPCSLGATWCEQWKVETPRRNCTIPESVGNIFPSSSGWMLMTAGYLPL